VRRVVVAILLATGALALVPMAGLPLFYESFLYLVLLWVALATSWNILSGYCGYFSFGHGAFFGAGMYTTAVLVTRYDVPFLWTLPAAAAIAAMMGTALGVVVFRVRQVRGELFALATLAFTFVVGTIVLNTPIDGGPGIALSGVAVPNLGKSAASSFYLLALALASMTLLAAYAVFHAKLGMGLFAIHDDEDVAEVLGVPTLGYKLAAFAISCAFAGIAGGLQALFVSYVTVSETFSITVPLSVVLMSVLGGTRRWAGPALGAALITGLLYAFTTGDHVLAGRAVFGGVLIVVILFMPEGVLGWFSARRRTAVARRPPSPVPVPGPSVHRVNGDLLLVARDIRRAFRGVQALDSVDLSVRRGEILGLLGPNGSGKSTFINLVSGHFRPDAGSLLFEGRDLAREDGHRIARFGVARTYQIPRPFAHMTVLANVVLPGMFGAAALDRATATHEAWRWLEFTHLAAHANALPDDLNLHQRKFLELARALAARPRLLLLDEVLSGLTPGEIHGAVELIRTIRDEGATIVFVEHVMRAVLALSDRLVVLDHGVVIAEGQPRAVMAHPDVVAAFLGQPHA
jgi:branched-chain amino acid transport system permease protein